MPLLSHFNFIHKKIKKTKISKNSLNLFVKSDLCSKPINKIPTNNRLPNIINLILKTDKNYLDSSVKFEKS